IARRAERPARTAVTQIPAVRSEAAALELRAAAQEHVTRSGRLEALRSTEQQDAAEDQTAASARCAAAEWVGQIATVESQAAAQHDRRPGLADQRDQAGEAAERLPGVQA